MRIVNFNGLGKPNSKDIKSGDILILLQETNVEIVQLKILSPDDYGPELTKVKNSDQLVELAKKAIKENHPECLKSERHWIFECPKEIKDQLYI